MKPTYQTSQEMVILAYLQKAIALCVALYFGVFYLLPIFGKATVLSPIASISFILVALLVFELILHFGLESFVLGWWKGEVQITNLIGVLFTFSLIGVLGWYATDNLPYFRSGIEAKIDLISLDSIRRVHGEKEKILIGGVGQKLSRLDSLYLPTLAGLKGQSWSLSQTQASYDNARYLLLQERKAELDKNGLSLTQAIVLAQNENEKRISGLEKQDKTDALGASVVAIVILVLSLYSTAVIGIYKAQSTKYQPSTNQVPTIEIAQNAVPLQNNINIVVQQKSEMVLKRYDTNKRTLATQYITENNYFNNDLSDTQRIEFLSAEFGISRTVYFRIKKDLKNEAIS
ncbi:MAG: hypothetical protein ACRC78_11150 [Planktothrix sp.]